MEAFDADRDFAEIRRNRRFGIIAQSTERGDSKERSPAFAGERQPVPRDALGVAVRLAHHVLERGVSEPCPDFLAQRAEIEAARFVLAREMDDIPDPVEIDGGVDAIILQQGNGDAGDRRRLHVGKRALQHRNARHADDGIDLSGVDQLHHQRRTLGHQHGVTEPLGLVL